MGMNALRIDTESPSSRQRRSPWTSLLGGILLLAMAMPAFVNAQDRRRQRRDAVEGMLRNLIDSEIPNRDSERNQPAVTNRQRATNRTTRTVPSNVLAIRENSAGFAREIHRLAEQLQDDVDRTNGVRSIMSDALRLSAAATMFDRSIRTAQDASYYADDYQDLDQKWRLLAYRLDRIRGMSGPVLAIVQRCNDYNQQLGDLFQIAPSVDRIELSRQITHLSNDLQNLLEDIDLEVDDNKTRYDLLVEGRRVFAQARRLNSMISGNTDFETTRQEYRTFRDMWIAFANRIRPLPYNYLPRQVQRVQRTDRTIQEFLLLAPEINRSELVYMTKRLQTNTNELLDSVSLRDLTRISSGRDQLVANAGGFNTACDDFVECVNNGDDEETLAELYYYLNGEWMQFGDNIRMIDTPAARQKFREIQQSVSELRDIVGVQPTISRTQGVQQAAALENLAGYYDNEVRRVVRGASYSPSFRNKAAQASQRFRNSSRSLHAELVKGENLSALQERSEALSRDWEILVAIETQFSPGDLTNLNKIRRRMTPLLVDMQAMLSR